MKWEDKVVKWGESSAWEYVTLDAHTYTRDTHRNTSTHTYMIICIFIYANIYIVTYKDRLNDSCYKCIRVYTVCRTKGLNICLINGWITKLADQVNCCKYLKKARS